MIVASSHNMYDLSLGCVFGLPLPRSCCVPVVAHCGMAVGLGLGGLGSCCFPAVVLCGMQG